MSARGKLGATNLPPRRGPIKVGAPPGQKLRLSQDKTKPPHPSQPPPVEPVLQPPPKQPQPLPLIEKKAEEMERRDSNQFGNLLPHIGSDHWDDELIPEWLCCQVHQEMITPPSSSDESYDSVDSHGKKVRKRRKKVRIVVIEEEEDEEEEEEEEHQGRQRTLSIPDVPLEGCLNKNKLRNMSLQQLQSALDRIYEEIEVLRIENLVFDRTVLKMEKREIEIEAALPPFTYKFPWEIEGAKKGIEVKALHPDAVCGELSDDEPEPPDGIYKPYIPAEDPDIDREAIGEMLNVNDDTEGERPSMSVTKFLESFGEIPPSNFDVVRHKYGDLVRFATYETPVVTVEEHNDHGSYVDPFSTGSKKEEKDQNGIEDDFDQRLDDDFELDIDPSLLVIAVSDFEEDPEFPGFNPHDTRKLPIGEKIKYAQIEEEAIRLEFYVTETKGIQQENSVQVYIDTYTDSYDLSAKLMDTFRTVIADGAHHLSGKMRAEKIQRFRDKLKKRFLEEEAKVKIKLTENMKKKRRVDKQLKLAQDIGGTIQLIDYENLRVKNYEYQSSIDDQHRDLKKLKLITTEWFERLERNRDRLNRSLNKRKNLEMDITVRGNLKTSLYAGVEKGILSIDAVTSHCVFLKKRLLAFSAPSTLEYISQKSTENHLEEEVAVLQNKVDAMNTVLTAGHVAFNRLLSMAPDKATIRQTTQTWLDEINLEVKENDLMYLLDDDSDSLKDFDQKFARKGQKYAIRETTSLPIMIDSNQSSIYLSGMSQSVTELYRVGKEKKRQSLVKHEVEHGLQSPS